MEKIDGLTDYDKERSSNEAAFRQLVQSLRPDIFVIMEALDLTGVNPNIIWKVIRHLHNIAEGTKYGTVSVKVENGVATFIVGDQSDRLNEDLIIKR